MVKKYLERIGEWEVIPKGGLPEADAKEEPNGKSQGVKTEQGSSSVGIVGKAAMPAAAAAATKAGAKKMAREDV
eukprot:4364278-Amphidinium_carterae.1